MWNFLEVVMHWVVVLLARQTQVLLIKTRCYSIDWLSLSTVRACGSQGLCGESRKDSRQGGKTAQLLWSGESVQWAVGGVEGQSKGAGR